ncbi:MAG: N-acetyltransferase [Pseudomonadales bacterium]|nr:N-acetyltransferase [Pseudomonadales bacterium]
MKLTALTSLQDISREDWDRCANPFIDRGQYDPFVSYHFLNALEKSGSASAQSGWAPYHLTLANDAEDILGVVPMYLKYHSQGEYVFDYAWADAFQRAGGRYYPKLQISIPFTPVTGRRILVADCANLKESNEDIEKQLLAGIMQVAEKLGVSSVHLTFLIEEQYKKTGELGFLQRTHNQFHWLNHQYESFDNFLAQLSAKKRKNIKRERREALSHGVEIEWLTGDEIEEQHWDAFFEFYLDTSSRKWGSPYLTRTFFSLIGETMSKDILLIMCKREGRYIAGAINFIGGDCLYGRNWGCIEHHSMLHFEVCYYQAIQFAIENGLSRVEAGAQGEHKLARGYLPSHTYSAHWIVNSSFSDAVSGFLEQERKYIDEEIDYMGSHSPFKQNL